jgi:hypothetical protein
MNVALTEFELFLPELREKRKRDEPWFQVQLPPWCSGDRGSHLELVKLE